MINHVRMTRLDDDLRFDLPAGVPGDRGGGPDPGLDVDPVGLQEEGADVVGLGGAEPGEEPECLL